MDVKLCGVRRFCKCCHTGSYERPLFLKPKEGEGGGEDAIPQREADGKSAGWGMTADRTALEPHSCNKADPFPGAPQPP